LAEAVAISPDYAFAHFNLGNVYNYRGKLFDGPKPWADKCGYDVS
jgi:hypothetical protein